MEGLTVDTICRRCGKAIQDSPRAEGKFCAACHTVGRRRPIRLDHDSAGPRSQATLPTASQSPSTTGITSLGITPASKKWNGLVSRIVPWAMSLVVHLVVALVAMTAVIIARQEPVELVIPAVIHAGLVSPRVATPLYAETPGGSAAHDTIGSPLAMGGGHHDSLLGLAGEVSRGVVASGGAAAISPSTSTLVGGGAWPVGSGLAAGRSWGGSLVGAAGGANQPSSFFGAGAVARHVVYVLDRSGSMLESFDDVCRQVLTSIGRLSADQDFHIILFADNTAFEMPAGRLVPPSRDNKLAAAEFLQSVRPAFCSNPAPAIRRAFDALASAGPGGKVIYLLSDGLLSDSDGLLRLIAERNTAGVVRINTYLFGARDEAAAEAMQRIARDNGGVFKQINPERLELAESHSPPGRTQER